MNDELNRIRVEILNIQRQFAKLNAEYIVLQYRQRELYSQMTVAPRPLDEVRSAQ